jgi:2-amino-4-hydroxy-6-hydroxymethyldihydropteridine diphosphokinase
VPQVAIGLGANLGDACATLARAALHLEDRLQNFRLSPIYASQPMYVEDQPVFTNAVGLGWTELSPVEVFLLLKSIEHELGRVPGPRYGPRQLDLDLLSYGALDYSFVFEDGSNLIVPHPRLAERRFVLEPLFSLAPTIKIPGLARLEECLASVADQSLELIYAELPI